MELGVQTDATCNIQQCWELLADNFAFFCTKLYQLLCAGPSPVDSAIGFRYAYLLDSDLSDG